MITAQISIFFLNS